MNKPRSSTLFTRHSQVVLWFGFLLLALALTVPGEAHAAIEWQKGCTVSKPPGPIRLPVFWQSL